MKNPIDGMNLESPVNYSKIQNPMENGKKTKKIKEMHARNLKASGVHPPKSPL